MRVVVADDAVILREGLARLLAEAGFEVVGLAADAGELLALMAEGRSNRAIAERLFVTEHTVEKHVKSIFGTLRLPPSPDDHRRVLAVVTFLNSQ